MKKLILIATLLFAGCATSTSPTSTTPVGKWATADLEYQITVSSGSATLFEKFNTWTGADSTFGQVGDSLVITFSRAGFPIRYSLADHSDSLVGTELFGGNPAYHNMTFYPVK